MGDDQTRHVQLGGTELDCQAAFWLEFQAGDPSPKQCAYEGFME